MYGSSRRKRHEEYKSMVRDKVEDAEKPEFESDGINSGSWYHCLPVRIYHG